MIELAGYQYLGPLGTPGNFGSVFHARNVLSGQDVAIKHIDQQMSLEAVSMWIAEARAMAACRHDNLVEILHAEVTPDGPALVMEYLPGGSVAARYCDDAVPVGDVVSIVIDVCWGLHRLHGEGLTHRDIKPANLLIGDQGVKIGDFGLAGDPRRPVDAVYVAHVPPELWAGAAWSKQADVYALAVTAWRLMWGDSASGRHDPDLQQRVMSGQWPDRGNWPDHVHKRLRTALRSAMDPNPARRPASAADLRSAVERARPHVSWQSVGALAWDGCATDGVRWTVVVRDEGGRHLVETSRNLGKGVRRVAVGCSESETACQARKAARQILESLATTGTLCG